MSTDTKALVSLESIFKSYRDGERTVEVLSGASLQIYRGESVAIIGPSGSGKSTLLHLMGGLDRRYQGKITIAGQTLSTLSDRQLSAFRASTVGFVFQSFNLLPTCSALENVLLPTWFSEGGVGGSGRTEGSAGAERSGGSGLAGAKGSGSRSGSRSASGSDSEGSDDSDSSQESRSGGSGWSGARGGTLSKKQLEEQAALALSRVGLAGKEKRLPSQLSGGERQRVAIARALFARPQLLLADEPTGNLDVKTAQGVVELFAELQSEGLTTVMVTHEERIWRSCQRVYSLRLGQLVAGEAA